MLGAHCFWLLPVGDQLRLSLLQILYRPYKAYEGGTQTTTGHISQQLANNHQQTCLELYGQTIIANWLHRCVLLSLAIILLPVCFSACFEGWCLGKPPHQAKQVGHAPESGGAGDPKACINDCKFASWKSKSTMLCCGIDAYIGPCEGKGKIDSDRLRRVWKSYARFNCRSVLVAITQQAEPAPKDCRVAEASKACPDDSKLASSMRFAVSCIFSLLVCCNSRICVWLSLARFMFLFFSICCFTGQCSVNLFIRPKALLLRMLWAQSFSGLLKVSCYNAASHGSSKKNPEHS